MALAHIKFFFNSKRKIGTFVTGVLLASPACFAYHDFAGFYLGGGTGFVFGNGSAIIHTDTSAEKRHMSGHAFSGDFFLGWGTVFGAFYMGAEADLGLQRMSGISQSNPTVLINTSFRLTLRNTYNLSFRFGYVPADQYLFYGRVGWSSSTWEGSFKENNDPTSEQKKTLYRPGLVVGVGMDGPLSGQWSWGCDFTYTSYSGFKTPYAPPAVPGFVNATPRIIKALMRIQYTF